MANSTAPGFHRALRREAQLLADGKPSTLKPEPAIATLCKIVLVVDGRLDLDWQTADGGCRPWSWAEV